MYSADQLNAKIKKVAQDLGVQDVNRVRGIVTLERIIARLVTNKLLKEHLVFGGGFVLYKELETNRYTRDADAVINGVNEQQLTKEIKASLNRDLEDGFWFGDVITEELATESGYGGLRFKILYKVGSPIPSEDEKRQLRRIHLDISIGVDLEDVARLKVTESILPSMDAIEWKIYPPEFIASEKIHCLLDRGDTNTRGKDVYDLPFIFDDVKDKDLLRAIERTFKRRSLEMDSLYEGAKLVDTEYLKKSYDLILIDDKTRSFEESWKIILKKLKALDALR
ncbi:MAG: nucleotidyl transferase AbiEii/AbiGii toxin family protein [Bacteriovoracia bacterium]